MVENNEPKLLINGGYPLHSFEEIQDLYKVYITEAKDRKLIEKAHDVAKKQHANQFRKSGEPYFHHLLEVSYILATLQCGPSTIAAGFLHDCVEDTDITIADIEKEFGKEVASIVDSLTKIQRLKLSKRLDVDFEAEDHRKIFLGMAKDIRVIIIKLADRLHNMRTLESLKPERQKALSKETLEVFSPIAHRLGLFSICSEMDDLCLKYLEPEKYNEIDEFLNSKNKDNNKSLESLKKRIADIVFEHNIPFEISSRVKSIYSIYKKLYVKNHTFDDIYDILAIRIITKTEINCYEILGLIHATYKPIPGRFKDYIAVPKPNMYQSLHTSIISGDGNIFEIQIRTREMDEVAECGIAAHWRYKEGTNYNPKDEQKQIEEKLHWFRDFVHFSSEENKNAEDFVSSLTNDIFGANVYVFTPLGKVVELPAHSTPIDFAYRIHSKVGDSAVGAIVNGNMVNLDTELKTGDVVEIKTSKTSTGPKERWLKIAKSNYALSHIKKFLLKKNSDLLRDERVEKGRQSCIDAFRDRGIDENEMIKILSKNEVLDKYNVDTIDDLFILVYLKNPSASAIVDFLNIKRKEETIKLDKKSTYAGCPVDLGSAGNVAVTLGSCCTPIPGDEIVGYITKGKGITIHRKDCPNIENLGKRLIDVKWKENLATQVYPVDIKIESIDRPNLLVDVLGAFSSRKISVISIAAKSHSNQTSTITATIEVTNSSKLFDIFNMILNIESVFEVSRVIH